MLRDSLSLLLLAVLPLTSFAIDEGNALSCAECPRLIPREHWDFMTGYKYEYGADCQVGWHDRTYTFLFFGKQCPDFSHEKLKNDALKSIDYVKKNSNAKNFSEYFSLMDKRRAAPTQPNPAVQAAQSYSIQQSRHDARQIWIQTCLGAKTMNIIPITQLADTYPHIQKIHISRLFGSATQTVSFMGGVINCNEQGTYTADTYTSDIDIRKKQ